MDKLEQDKMIERLDFSFSLLKAKCAKENIKISDDVFFIQACEMARTFFVRSEIAYSEKNKNRSQNTNY